MEHVRRELKVSERRACRVLGKALTVQQYTPQFREDENALTGRIVELSSKYGRHGTPRITGLLLNEGLLVNQKRVEQIWRSAGLKVPKKQPWRGRLWLKDGNCVQLRPERKDHVWPYDFVSARKNEGLALRVLMVV